MKTPLPRYWCYGDHTGNYGTHCLAFEDAAGNTFYFSYDTLVAFRPSGGSLRVRQNSWGTTTGKHLNAIDQGCKSDRLSGKDFDETYQHYFGDAKKLRHAA